jgi:pimeloyl-ACP methyl ester carboxylesterase
MQPFDHKSGQTFEVDGAHLYYEVHGEETALPLLFLHGGFGNIEDFNPLLPGLKGNFRVIGLDSRGHGKSTLGPAPLTYERLQRDVELLADHLRLGPLSVVGFSDGGIVAYRLAALAPQKTRRLVAIGAHFELRANDPVRQILAGVTAESWRKKFPDNTATYERLNPAANFDTFAAAVVRMWLDFGATGYPNDLVRKIACDLLIVRGDDDHLFSREHAFELGRRLRRAKLANLPFAGHEVFKDQPELCALALNPFFKT